MVIIILIMLLLLSWGIYMAKINFKPCNYYFKMRKWEKVKGEITEIFVNEKWYGIMDEIPVTKALSVKYKYQTGDKEYTSCNIYPDKPFTSISSLKTKEDIYKRNIKTIINSIKKKPSVYIYVNPSKPEESSLMNYSQNVTFMVFSITIILWSIFFFNLTTNLVRFNLIESVIVIEKK